MGWLGFETGVFRLEAGELLSHRGEAEEQALEVWRGAVFQEKSRSKRRDYQCLTLRIFDANPGARNKVSKRLRRGRLRR